MNIYSIDLLPEHAIGRNGLLVLLASPASNDAMLALTAHLAQRGPVYVLDGGNRFNAYRLARALSAKGSAEGQQALARIRVARAFTFYQMAALLEKTAPGRVPTLVIDLLNTFYDENAPLGERRRLLETCLGCLHSLALITPVVVSLRPPHLPQVDAAGFMELVQAAADHVLFQEEIHPSATQLQLF